MKNNRSLPIKQSEIRLSVDGIQAFLTLFDQATMTLQLKKLRYDNNMTQLVMLNFWIWEEKKEKERQITTRYENRRTFILIVTIDYQSFPSFHESCNCNLMRMVILTPSMSLKESLFKKHISKRP